MNHADILSVMLVPDDVAYTRYEADALRVANAALAPLRQALVERLKVIDPTEPDRKRYRDQRVAKLVIDIRPRAKQAYDEVIRVVEGSMRDLAPVVAEATTGKVNRSIPELCRQVAGRASVALETVALFSHQLADAEAKALVSEMTIQGRPARAWWRAQRRDMVDSYAEEVRKGLRARESVTEIAKRLTGPRGLFYRKNLNVETLVSSSANSVTNAARGRLYELNGDVIRAIQWRSVLDSRTSFTCRALSGGAWTLPNYEPLPGTSMPWQGYPPAHWNCRSTTQPVFRAAPELAKRRDRLRRQLAQLPREGTKLVDGQLAGGLTYEGFLKKSTERLQRKVLGPTRYELWSQGKLSLTDMVDQRGRPLTLEQLRAEVL